MIKGIYTSDSLEKSMNYVGYGSGNTGFVLLCEVRIWQHLDQAKSVYVMISLKFKI